MWLKLYQEDNRVYNDLKWKYTKDRETNEKEQDLNGYNDLEAKWLN